MTAPHPSRRSSPRLPRRERVFVRIERSDLHPELRGTMARCSTSDISGGGLRITVDYPVEPDTRLELWLKLAEHPATFLLSGVVRWTTPGKLEGEQVLGVALEPGPADTAGDLTEWRQVLDVLASRR